MKKADKEQTLHTMLMAQDWENPTKDMASANPEQYALGMKVEGKEHADIAHGDVGIIHKIVMAHLKEMPDYYTKLQAMDQKDEIKEGPGKDKTKKHEKAEGEVVHKEGKEEHE